MDVRSHSKTEAVLRGNDLETEDGKEDYCGVREATETVAMRTTQNERA